MAGKSTPADTAGAQMALWVGVTLLWAQGRVAEAPRMPRSSHEAASVCPCDAQFLLHHRGLKAREVVA